VFISKLMTVSAISWSDIFPALQPYQEPDEDGEARVGFIQLNSGSTSFNTTLNLTGPILLGLGIAAATLFYAYFNAFNGFSRKKRSVNDLSVDGMDMSTNDLDQASAKTAMTVLEAVELLETLDQFLESLDVTSRECKMRTVCHIYQVNPLTNENSGHSVSDMVRLVLDSLLNSLLNQETDPQLENRTRDWTNAARSGQLGKSCKELYPECRKYRGSLLSY